MGKECVRHLRRDEKPSWICPLCPMGLTGPPGSKDLGHARKMHRIKHHPKAAAKKFMLKKGNAQAMRKVQRKGRENARARVIMELQTGGAGGHDVVILVAPAKAVWKSWWAGKTLYYCQRCHRVRHRVKDFAPVKCLPGQRDDGDRRMKVVKTLEKARKKADGEEAEKVSNLLTVFKRSAEEMAKWPASSKYLKARGLWAHKTKTWKGKKRKAIVGHEE